MKRLNVIGILSLVILAVINPKESLASTIRFTSITVKLPSNEILSGTGNMSVDEITGITSGFTALFPAITSSD